MADWDRLPDEPTLWFDRFERFRRMGPTRSLLGCLNAEREKAHKSAAPGVPGAWNDASDRWRWRERATAWDDEQVRLAREAESAALAERRQVWISQAMAIQTKAWKRLKDMDASELTVKETLEYFREGVKLELLSRGQPESIQALTGKDGGAIAVRDDGLRGGDVEYARGLLGVAGGDVPQDDTPQPVDT